MKNKYLIGGVVAVMLVLGMWTYTQAVGNTIATCVGKDLSLKLSKDGVTCDKGQTLLTWNIQGPKGDKGDVGAQGSQGIQGDTARQGAGNIAFCDEETFCRIVLKTDGTLWQYNPSYFKWEPRQQPDSVQFQQRISSNGQELPF